MSTTSKKIIKQRMRQRKFELGQYNNMFNSWVSSIVEVNTEIEGDLEAMRTRSRDLAKNDPIMKRYLSLLKDNIVGAEGFDMRPQVRRRNGKLDTNTNTLIRDDWMKWSKNAMVDGTSWVEAQKQFIANVGRDGECIVMLKRGRKYGRNQFQIQFTDPALLDVKYHEQLQNTQVYSGIEYDNDGIVVAYHLWERHPNDPINAVNRQTNRRIRVAAENMLLCYVKDYPFQLRGYPWAHTVGRDIKNIHEYEFSETIAARVATLLSVFAIKNEEFAEDTEVDEEQPVAQALDPGTMMELPAGYDIKTLTPTNHPNQGFDGFQKAVLQRIASGLDVSYFALSSDLSQANYSSMRQAALTEQERYKSIQAWMAECFNQKVYNEWLQSALLTTLELPMTKQEDAEMVNFVPRSFPYVDPDKDIKATQQELDAGLTSKTEVSSKRGKEYEAVLMQRQEDRELEEKYQEPTQETSTESDTSDETDTDSQETE